MQQEIGKVNISNTAVDKYLSKKAVDKSGSKELHLSALRVLPSLIEKSIVGELHVDKQRNSNIKDIVRLYSAIGIGEETYRVKTTVKRYNDSNTKSKAYSYDVTEIELPEGLSGATHTQSVDFTPTSSNSITGAKLLNGALSDKKKGEIFNDFYTNKKSPAARKTRSEEARASDTDDSGAKIRKDAETAIENAEKVSEQRDREYAEAVERGDMEKVDAMLRDFAEPRKTQIKPSLCA